MEFPEVKSIAWRVFAEILGITLDDVLTTATTVSNLNAGQLLGKTWTTESAIAPTLLNSWVNYEASWEVAGYWKDQFGVVHLHGLVKDGTGLNVPIFTLPVGYRPANEHAFTVMSNAGAGLIIGLVTVASSGDVTPSAGGTTYMGLFGIHFRTD